MVLAIDASRKLNNQARTMCQQYLKDMEQYQYKTRICKLAVNGMSESFSNIKRNLMIGIVVAKSGNQAMSLTNRLQHGNNPFYTTDYDFAKLKEANKKASNLLEKNASESDNVKENVLPLQGKLWRNYSEQLKASKQSTRMQTVSTVEAKKAEMKKQRQEQFRAFRKRSGLMKAFLDNLLDNDQSDEEHILFITYLKLFLDDRSRRLFPEFLSRYLKAWQEWKAARDLKETNIIMHQEILRAAEHNLAEASFGFEHLMRECGQIYEAIIECKEETLDEHKTMATLLRKTCAKLLLLGQPFELMDGDVANVPLKWVKDVLFELKQLIGDKKLLSLSVLGIQSSGKSTLLNTMFGLQFAVSAGRCTRGVFIQLIPVDSKEYKFDYILVIDTGGLHASELAHEKYDHDNKLATFVIGLGDVTIINIKGENTAEIKDILQIAVHAFLRLNLSMRN